MPVDHQDLALFDHPSPDQSPTSGEDAHLAGELTGAMDGDELVTKQTRPDDLQSAAKNDVDPELGRALLEEDLPGSHMTSRAVTRDPLELRVAQLREHLRPA